MASIANLEARMRSIAACLALSWVVLTGCYGPSSQPESEAQKSIRLWQANIAVGEPQPEQRIRLTDQIERLRARGWIGSISVLDSANQAMECGPIDSMPMPELPAHRFPVQ